MFCGIIFVPSVLRTSCLFNFKCTFQGLTSQRPKLKHTYHKGVQHMHSSWQLHCDMKDLQALDVISKMSKAWPFRCPTPGKHPQPAKLQASESWKSDHRASHSHWLKTCVTLKIDLGAEVGVTNYLEDVSLCRNPYAQAPGVTQGAAELGDGVTLPFCLPAPPPHGFQAQGSGSGGSP